MTSTRQILQKLVPFGTLSESSLSEVIKATQVVHIDRDDAIFHEGDEDAETIFLLQGSVSLTSKSQPEPRVLKAGSNAAQYAIAQLKPRQLTGVATKPSIIARIDQNILDHIVTMDEISGIEVVEMDTENRDVEWVFKTLSSSTFSRLPPVNANQMLARMEEMEVSANQVIINQGEPGDYYYLIREGTATVAITDQTGTTAIVNELNAGDQFGEEALLSDAPRNATIIMKTNGLLMRLTREDFKELLSEPMLAWVEQADADAMIGQGAGILDVRTADEYRNGAINKSLNIPLAQIRQLSEKLDRTRNYVIYCQTGKRSAVAAFMLNQRGFNTVALKGGLMAISGLPAV